MLADSNLDNNAYPCLIAQVEQQALWMIAASTDNPEVPLPPGLRPLTLTIEEAEEIRRLLDDEKQPVRQGREMPTADASVLLKKKR